MIVDSRNIIRKLDTKSVLEFLKESDRPLVIYGIGEIGMFVYEALKKHDLPVHALADGSADKQGKLIDGMEILSWQAALERYPNALFWLTIANEVVCETVIDDILAAGFRPLFFTANLKYPMAKTYYRDWDGSKPIIIIGKGADAAQACDTLISRGYAISHIISTNPETDMICGRKTEPFGRYLDARWNTDANYIICDERKWDAIINALHEGGVYERIYRYTVGTYGTFAPEKYVFENALFLSELLRAGSNLNGLYYSMSDDASKAVFKTICYKALRGAKNKTLIYNDSYVLSIFENARRRLRCKQGAGQAPQRRWQMSALEADIPVFLRFLDELGMYYRTSQSPSISMRLDDREITVTYLAGDGGCID